MTREATIIARSGAPLTAEALTERFRAIGVTQGMDLMLHMSLSAIGWVSGGAEAVLSALIEALGPSGTLMMATPSSQLTDPRCWCAPAVPEAWWSVIRSTLPAYSPAVTPTRGVGVGPEIFRHLPATVRSGHPACSFAAHGARAVWLTASHNLDRPFGEGSPLAKLYAVKAFRAASRCRP